MLEYAQCDITTIQSGLIGHGVNCRHAFGSGVAKAILDKWPFVKQRYMEMPSGEKMLGSVHVISINENLDVANMYTQVNYGYDGKQYADVDAISRSVEYICGYARSMGITNIYLPQIGCKRGGLDWDTQVLPVLNRYAELFPELTITICIHEEK